MNFSLEIGPSMALDNLPALKDVYITFLPGGNYKETTNKAEELVKKGFNPIPHFPARSIEDEALLKEYILRCKGFRGAYFKSCNEPVSCIRAI